MTGGIGRYVVVRHTEMLGGTFAGERYADRHFRSKPGGIAFGPGAGQERPSSREFAYVAFTIGMTYQVSAAALREPRIRYTVRVHATVSYLFGVVMAGSVNLTSRLLR